MTKVALVVDRDDLPSDEDEVFLWDGSVNDSFKTSMRPNLQSLGPVSDLNADFVRVALAVYASDRTVLRQGEGSNWSGRLLDLSIPVSNVSTWESITTELAGVTRYLTGDEWHFRFCPLTPLAVSTSLLRNNSTRVLLISGGADSASGAMISAAQLGPKETHTFVSHASNSIAGSAQLHVQQSVDAFKFGTIEAHHRIHLSRTTHRLDGTAYDVESSSRSRSLLFLALGLAVSSQNNVPLWISENGFASLNPPLTAERVGVLSTRTTQPWFLWRLANVLASIGVYADIVNPFQMQTKGQMFARVEGMLGNDVAAQFLSATNSCSHTDQNWYGVPSGTHCGVCFGCILRRASFSASGLRDDTRYLSREGDRFAPYLASHDVRSSVHDFVSVPFDRSTVMAMPLPPTLSAERAFDVCLRGRDELRGIV